MASPSPKRTSPPAGRQMPRRQLTRQMTKAISRKVTPKRGDDDDMHTSSASLTSMVDTAKITNAEEELEVLAALHLPSRRTTHRLTT